MTEGSERVDVTVDRKHGGPPKVGEKSPKVGGAFNSPMFHRHFANIFVQIGKQEKQWILKIVIHGWFKQKKCRRLLL